VAERRFAGFDLGGSKTVCLIGDERRILGRGTAGGGNPSVVGLTGSASAVREAFAAAFREVRLGLEGGASPNLDSAWLGAAGADSPETVARLRAEVAGVLGCRTIEVSNDAALILPAAGMTAGVALIAGTGSFAQGTGPDGRITTAGGWGYLFGDEGSGYELGRLALRAVSHAADGRGPSTILTERILGALGLKQPRQLSVLLHPGPPASVIAQLARQVLVAAELGDAVARGLVDGAVTELAAMIRACSRRSGLAADTGEPVGTDPIGVVVAGGLASPGSPLVPALATELGPARYRVMPLTVEPAQGALALARRSPPAV
jgi:N-acetylglucosamine kinase-like BadF-type ATPase